MRRIEGEMNMALVNVELVFRDDEKPKILVDGVDFAPSCQYVRFESAIDELPTLELHLRGTNRGREMVTKGSDPTKLVANVTVPLDTDAVVAKMVEQLRKAGVCV
jgi:hypothetical protein